MLVLTRKVGERIQIGDVEVVITRINATRVGIGVVAPKDVLIRRGELVDKDRKDAA